MVLSCVVEPMRPADLDEVVAIERASFPRPWPRWAFESELSLPYTCYLVARPRQEPPEEGPCLLRRRPGPAQGPIWGYAGMQVILEEGHIMTLAVHPEHRRRGIGTLLLLHLFAEARKRKVLRLTLEVRETNLAAQCLYRQFGFAVAGRRRRYYSDGEDALIMWSDRLDTLESQARLERLRSRLPGGKRFEREERGDLDSGPGDVL